MFHYVDPNEEMIQKKRVVQRLIKANKVDRGLGLTAPESKKVDDLLKACEDIETQATIVLKALSQSLLRSSPVQQDSIQRFYVAIRKGLFALSRSSFKQTPRTDIQNLTDYRDNLIKLQVGLVETFNLLNEEMYGNEPLQGRTVEDYQAQTGRPYRPPVPAKTLSDFIGKKVDKNTEILLEDEENYQQAKRIEQGLQQLYDMLDSTEKEIDGLQKRVADTQAIKEAEEQNLDRERQRIQRIMIDGRPNVDARIEAVTRNAQPIIRKIQVYEDSLEELEARRRQLPVIKRNIEVKILEQEEKLNAIPVNRPIIPIQRLTSEEYQNQLYFEKRGQIVTADYSLVMKDFNIFINSLTDGLIRYTSGISSQLSRSQETNYRTPTERAEATLGAGMYKDLTKGIHTRFL
jgi:hypothetical protein